MRKFQLRVGINSNTDNLVTDINGNKNIAGQGINMAARIMSVANGNQIIVGNSVYETLIGREKYMKSFVQRRETVKHGLTFYVYQYVAKNCLGLNTKTRTPPVPILSSVEKFPQLVAYYIAHGIKNRGLFIDKIEYNLSYEGKVFLWFLANESLEFSNASDAKKAYLTANKKIFDSPKERYEYYEKQDYGLLGEVAKLINSEIMPFARYFEGYDEFIFVTPEGLQKLKEEWGDICIELEIG